MSLRDVMQFLDEYETCVLATVSVDGKPQSATVDFLCSKERPIFETKDFA